MTQAELETLLRVATAYYGIALGTNSTNAYGEHATLWNYGVVADKEPLFRKHYMNGSSHSGDSTDHCERVADMARYIEKFPEGRVKQTLLWQIRDGYDFCVISSLEALKKFPADKQGFVLLSEDSVEQNGLHTKIDTALYYVNTHSEPRQEIELTLLENTEMLSHLKTALFGAESIEAAQNLDKDKLLHLSARQLKIIMERVNLTPLSTQLAEESIWTEEDELYSLSLYQIFQGVQDRFRGAIGKKNLFFKTDERDGIVVPTVIFAACGVLTGPGIIYVAPVLGGLAFTWFSGIALWNAHIARDAYRHTRKLHQISNQLHKKDNTQNINMETEARSDMQALLDNNNNSVNNVRNAEDWSIANNATQLSPHQRWLFESRGDIGRHITRLMYAIYQNDSYQNKSALLKTILEKARLFPATEIQSLFMLEVSPTMTLIDAFVESNTRTKTQSLDVMLSSTKPTTFLTNTGYIYQKNEQLRYIDKSMSQCNYRQVTNCESTIISLEKPSEESALTSKTLYLDWNEKNNQYITFTIKKANGSLLRGTLTAEMLPYHETNESDYDLTKKAIQLKNNNSLTSARKNRIVRAIIRAHSNALVNETDFSALPENFYGLVAYKQWSSDSIYQLYYVDKKQSPMQMTLFNIPANKQAIVNDWISDIYSTSYGSGKLSAIELSGIQSCIAENQKTLFSLLCEGQILSLSENTLNPANNSSSSSFSSLALTSDLSFNVEQQIGQEIAALSSSESSKKLENIDCLKAVYKQVAPQILARLEDEMQWLTYIESLRETPIIQLVLLRASLKANPILDCTKQLNDVFASFSRNSTNPVNIIDVVYTLTFQEKRSTPSLHDIEDWINPLPTKYQNSIWLTLLINPTQQVIDWLKKRSGAKEFLTQKKEKYGEALGASELDNAIRKIMNASTSIFSFKNSRGVGTVISSNPITREHESELVPIKTTSNKS